MKQKIDIHNWIRKDHYQFFKGFDEPFYGVCVNIDCTHAYRRAKELETSFFLYYLHKSVMAANRVEAFRFRIEGDEVYLYDVNAPDSTIDRPNGTFGFAYFDYYDDYQLFEKEACKVIDKVRNSTTLDLCAVPNAIHYSAVPWINFTSLSHARHFFQKESCPKISFGKMTQVDGKRMMPLSVHVHHALVDGVDVGKYIDEFQRLMDE